MEPSFWHERWEMGQIGFHKAEVHPDLIQQSDWLLGGNDWRVLVPLCGKTLDLDYIARQGDTAIGVELSEIAARQAFEEAGREPTVTRRGAITRFEHGRMVILVGNVFDVTPDHVGRIDRVWDRAAMVALTPAQRREYVPHLRALTMPGTRILLNTLVYDDCDKQGPPHSVTDYEISAHYEGADIQLVERRDLSHEIRDTWREAGMTRLASHLHRITLTETA